MSATGAEVTAPSYFCLLSSLFVMGLGMGGTKMPIMTSARPSGQSSARPGKGSGLPPNPS
jgi:hypothetical protein